MLCSLKDFDIVQKCHIVQYVIMIIMYGIASKTIIYFKAIINT